MGWGSSSMLAKINLILVILAFIIQLIAFAIPYWFSKEYDTADVEYYGGLWRNCYKLGTNSDCSAWDSDLPDWFKATQAMETIGWLLLLAAVVVIIIYIFLTDKKVITIIFVILCFSAFGFIIIGVIVYGVEAFEPANAFSASFGLAIVAAILALVCGVLGLLDALGVVERRLNRDA